MSWQPWTDEGERVDPDDPTTVLVAPVLVGLLTGLLTVLVGFVLVVAVLIGVSDRTGDDGWLVPTATVLWMLLLAGASALATGLVGRRLRGFRLRPALARRARLGTGLVVGGSGLLLGLAPGTRWVTVPAYLVAIPLGCLLAERRLAASR